MATNTDFNTLIGRIDTATTTLENNVNVLVQSSTDVTQSVTEAKGYATEAKNSATQSAQNATIATTQATKATTEASKAINAVDEAKALAPFQEAPKTGSVYGRKDGTWALVENSGSGGGVGTVVSVNGISPDIQGNVTLTIPEQVNSDWNAISGKSQILNKPTLFSGAYADLTGKPILFSGSYTDLTNKPTIPTNTNQLTNGSGFITEAPNDTKQYARSGATWVEVVAGSGGGNDLGFKMPFQNIYYNSKLMTNWVSTNPNDAIDLSKLGSYVNGEFYRGADFFKLVDGIDALVTGRYFFKLAMLPTPLNNSYGYIDVVRVPLGGAAQDEVTATAYVLNANNEIKDIYVYNINTRGWSLQAGLPAPQPATKVVNKRTGLAFEEWIGTQAQYDAITTKDPNTRYWITEA